LLENRKESVEEGDASFAEKIAWKLWKKAMLNRKLMNMGNQKIKNWVVNSLVKGWSAHRADLQFPAKSFNEEWKATRKR